MDFWEEEYKIYKTFGVAKRDFYNEYNTRQRKFRKKCLSCSCVDPIKKSMCRWINYNFNPWNRNEILMRRHLKEMRKLKIRMVRK